MIFHYVSLSKNNIPTQVDCTETILARLHQCLCNSGIIKVTWSHVPAEYMFKETACQKANERERRRRRRRKKGIIGKGKSNGGEGKEEKGGEEQFFFVFYWRYMHSFVPLMHLINDQHAHNIKNFIRFLQQIFSIKITSFCLLLNHFFLIYSAQSIFGFAWFSLSLVCILDPCLQTCQGQLLVTPVIINPLPPSQTSLLLCHNILTSGEFVSDLYFSGILFAWKET